MANQKNFDYFTYTDDNAVVWNKRGWLDTAVNAMDGSTALTPGAPVWPHASRKFHVRYAIWQDPTTFRTVKTTIYTNAAMTALSGASTLAVSVPGNTGTVTYNLAQKVGEKQPFGKTSRKLADHT